MNRRDSTRRCRLETLERRDCLSVIAPVGFGCRYPVGPQASLAVPAGVRVTVNQSLAEMVQQYPSGTVFVLDAGVHKNEYVKPRANDQFWGRYGAILDGGGTTPRAFEAVGGGGVLIANLVIRNYATPLQGAAVEGAEDGWVIRHCEIAYNAAIGARANQEMSQNYVHDNGQMGLASYFSTGTLISDNLLTNNNKLHLDDGTGAATKLWSSVRTTIQYNTVTDNFGGGIWLDTSNLDTTIQYNYVARNTHGYGIVNEVGYASVIRNNYVEQQADLSDGTPRGGIAVISSPDNEITGNVVKGCATGVLIAGENNDGGLYGQRSQRNAWVHDNIFTSNTAHARVADWGSDAFAAGLNNRFDHNTYSGAGGKCFEWKSMVSFAGWQAVGQDMNSAYRTDAVPLSPPDLQATSDTGTSSDDNITADNTPTFDVSVPVGSYFRFYRDGVRISGNYEAGTTYTTALQQDGTCYYTIAVVDAAGNVSSQSPPIAVAIDTRIQGGAGNDAISITRSALDATKADVVASNSPSYSASLPDLAQFVVLGNAGDDQVMLDFSNGNALPTGGLTLDGGPGRDTLRIVARSGGDVTVSASSVLVPGAGPITLSNVERFEFDLGAARLIKSGGGAVVLAGANSYSGGTTVSAGTLQLTSLNALPVGGTLTIGAGATVVLASGLSAGAESMAAAIAVAGPALAAIAPATGSTSASQATVSKPPSMPQATAIAKTVAASALVPPYRVGARERVFGSAGLRGRDDLAWLRPLAELRAQNQLPRKNAVALFAVNHVLGYSPRRSSQPLIPIKYPALR